MKQAKALLLAVAFSLFPRCVSSAFGQSVLVPVINAGGIVNAASYAQPAVLAPGVIFSIFGTNLSDGATAQAGVVPLPVRLAGARVLVNGVAAPLFFASPSQINAQFPVELAGLSTASIQVEVQTSLGTLTGSPVSVVVAPVSPGIFTWNQNGSGPGAILRASDFSKVCPAGRSDCPANRVAPGEAVAVYMTGLGTVNGPWASGQAAAQAYTTVATPTVTIGGVAAEVLFSGLAAGFVGLYQVNVRVPSNAPTGDNVAFSLSIGGRTSNQVTIAIASSMPPPPTQTVLYCSLPLSGVFKSNDGGQSWVAVNSGLPPFTGFSALAVDPTSSSTVYAGTDLPGGGGPGSYGVFKTTDEGQSWTAANSGLPTVAQVNALAVDPLDPLTLYASTVVVGIFRSRNGGASWTAVLPIQLVSAAIAIDPRTPANVYAGTSSGLFKSTDRGTTWTQTGSGTVGGVYALTIDPTDPLKLYAGALGTVYRTVNGGQSWTSTSLPVNVNSLAINPSDAAAIYAGTSSGIYRSVDRGATWSALGLPSSSVSHLVIDPGNPRILYAGTSAGIFKSTDGGSSWSAASNGLSGPLLSISALAIGAR